MNDLEEEDIEEVTDDVIDQSWKQEKHWTTRLHQIYRAKTTQVEMLSQRGYNIEKHEQHYLKQNSVPVENALKFQTNHSKYIRESKNNLDNFWRSLSGIYQHNTLPVQCVVKWMPEISGSDGIIGKYVRASIYEHLQSIRQGKAKLLIIGSSPLKTADRVKLEEINNNVIYPSEYWDYGRLIINPTKHIHTPVHQLASADEIKRLPSDVKLPNILLNDIIVQYYQFKIGDIIKIIRTVPISGKSVKSSIYYRRVIRTANIGKVNE